MTDIWSSPDSVVRRLLSAIVVVLLPLAPLGARADDYLSRPII